MDTLLHLLWLGLSFAAGYLACALLGATREEYEEE